jgi:hypothetical protein
MRLLRKGHYTRIVLLLYEDLGVHGRIILKLGGMDWTDLAQDR